MSTRPTFWTVSLGLLVLLAYGCGADDPAPVRLEGQCAPLTDATRMVASDDGVDRYGLFVGTVGSHVLVGWSYDIGGGVNVAEARWYDGELQVAGGVVPLGTGGPLFHPRLLPADGSLWGQFWVDPSGSVPPAEPENVAALWRLDPPPDAGFEPFVFELPISRVRTCVECPLATMGLGSSSLGAGNEARLPAAVVEGRVVSAASATPDYCPTYLGTTRRLLLLETNSARTFTWTEDPCQELPNTAKVSNIELASLNDGSLGALFRLGSGEGRGDVHYLRLTRDLEPIYPVQRVGGRWTHFTTETGYQPKAAALGDARVLWTERTGWTEGAGGSSYNVCQELRIMGQDGSMAGPAPYQLSCRSNDTYVTKNTELLSLPDGRAALVFGERRDDGGPGPPYPRITSAFPWQEGIHLALLTSDGLRGSEIADVTDAAATALTPVERTEDSGPVANDFAFAAASDGDEVVVVWQDARAGSPGIYGRRFRCAGFPRDRP